MSTSAGGDRTEPFPLGRRGTVDAMRVAGRRSDVHGPVEFEVTEARRLIEERGTETGERLSFTCRTISSSGYSESSWTIPRS